MPNPGEDASVVLCVCFVLFIIFPLILYIVYICVHGSLFLIEISDPFLSIKH